jgi:hypothetical protein
MKTFQDYLQLKESTAMDIGTSIMGKSSLGQDAKGALLAAMEVFEVLLSRKSSKVISWLNQQAQADPQIQQILDKYNISSFKDGDFASDVRRAATRGRRTISKGLGDNLCQEDDDADVVSPNPADSFHNPIG